MMEARGYRTILVTAAAGVTTISLNRPDRRNAINPEMLNEMIWAMDDAADDADTRVVVITGAQNDFSVGGDLGSMSGQSSVAHKGDFPELLLRFTQIEKPTIAKVRGNAMGGALGIIASCDFAIASDTAIFGTPEIRRGFFPFMILAPMSRVMPRRKLIELILLGDKFSPADAERWNLITHSVPETRLDSEVEALAAKLVEKSPTALRLGLRAYRRYVEEDLATSLPALRDALIECLGTDDAREGLAAFMEKREPRWTGR